MSLLTSLKEIADYKKVCMITLKSYILEYEFPAVKLGKSWHATTEDIDKWDKNIINIVRKKEGKEPV